VGEMMKTETFEEKLAYAKEVLEKLMDPEITLEESVKLYEEGLKNIKEAQKLIEEAKMKVSVIDRENQQMQEDI
jgi:exodeoxyribonuclease VII small subunit